MAWKLIERCWCKLKDEIEQLWDYLTGDDCLILRTVPFRTMRRQLSRCASERDPVKSSIDPNRFELD
jgi:hypothetical protein